MIERSREYDEHLSRMGRSIPGQSLTQNPDEPWPWEKPTEFTVLQEAIDYLFVTMSEVENYQQIVEALSRGASVLEVTRLILFQGFTEGKWNPDLFLMLIEPTAYLIMGLAERAGLNDFEIMKDEDEELFGTTLTEETIEGIKDNNVPVELETKIDEVEIPQIETPSLMQRR